MRTGTEVTLPIRHSEGTREEQNRIRTKLCDYVTLWALQMDFYVTDDGGTALTVCWATPT